jgi:hypothetical protein
MRELERFMLLHCLPIKYKLGDTKNGGDEYISLQGVLTRNTLVEHTNDD